MMAKSFIILILFSMLIQDQPTDNLFKEGKSWTYLAKTTKNGDLQKVDTLRLTVEKGHFVGSQQKIAWSLAQIKPDGSKEEIFEITGVVENEDRIWIHPPRFKHLKFTELTAFPEIRFPMDSNKKWTSTIAIGKGWGEWENHEVKSSYELAGKTSSEIDSTQCYRINAISKSKFGTFHTSYHFNFTIGFEYIKYDRPDNITTELRLIPKNNSANNK